jgi:hypothetical protein
MGQVMERITTYPNGGRIIHRYEEMTAEKRPRSAYGWAGLQFRTMDHHGMDCCAEVIVMMDSEHRSCTYRCEEKFSETSERPEDQEIDCSGLRF